MRACGRFAHVELVTHLVYPQTSHERSEHLTLARRERLERCELTVASRAFAPAFVHQVDAALSGHEWLANRGESHLVDEAIEILDLLDQTDRSRLQALAKAHPVGRAGDHNNPYTRCHEWGDHLRAVVRFAKVEIEQHDVRVLMQAVSYDVLGPASIAKVDRVDIGSLCGER